MHKYSIDCPYMVSLKCTGGINLHGDISVDFN